MTSTKVTTNCPHCNVHIEMDVPGDPPPMINLLPMVHCSPCNKLYELQYATRDRISAINDRIRNCADSAEIDRLNGNLKAQYSSAKLIRGKLDKRRTSTQKDCIDKTPNTSLPW